jgi:hypothetical protein
LEYLLIDEKENYEDEKLIELFCVGAGIGEGILHTDDLHVLEYKVEMIGAN